ncbi:MAG: fatty acid desaturase [Actinomycetota bacterium]
MTDAARLRTMELQRERRLVAPYRGGIAVRLLVTFVAFTVVWIAILVAGFTGALPLWLGAILSFVVATTFYMPLHEAAHGNVWGDVTQGKWMEDTVGMVSAIPVGFSFRGHRISHMKHHAHTNDPEKDPDFFAQGELRELPVKFYGVLVVYTLLPLLAVVPALTRLLPRALRDNPTERDPIVDRYAVRYWAIQHLVLLAAFIAGVGVEALLLWYVPTRLVVCWLGFIFAWFPHHPADGKIGRYVDTRVAVFRGSGLLVRGHDHHALHHLFPRVVHYKLPKLWHEIGPEMTAKGVRTEGRALGATGPITW